MSNRLAALSTLVLGTIVVGAIVLSTMLYTVDERQQAVILQFGRPVTERTEPGIYLKMPLIQSVVVLPKTRQFWLGNPLPDLPTKDDKKIEVEPWAIWRISDPTLFVQRMRTLDTAQARVRQFTRSAMRDVVTQYDLAELVRSTDRPMMTSSGQVGDGDGDETVPDVDQPTEARQVRMNIQFGREIILNRIKEEASRRLRGETPVATTETATTTNGPATDGRGIELIDLGISHIEFVESVRNKTFDRWIAERKAISDKNTSEGERMKQGIINKAAADAERIVGEGQRRANELRGEVDAELITQYAAAIQETGDFYNFVRTLEAYEKAITGDTKMILTTDSDFLGLLKVLPAPHTGAARPNPFPTGNADAKN